MAFENGKTAFGNRNFAAAESHFRRAVEIDGDEAMYWNWLGVTLNARGEHAGAASVFDQALGILDQYPVTNGPAERHLMRLEATVQSNKGNALREMQRYAEALHCYEAALNADPGQERLFYEMGNLYLKTRQFERAEEMFRKSMVAATSEDDPQRVKTRLGLAILYHLTGRDELALNQVQDIEGSGFRVAADLRDEIVRGATRAQEARRTASLYP